MKTCALTGSALVLALAATTSQAADVYATTVENASQGLTKGGGLVPVVRSNPLSALGAPSFAGAGTYYSLGFGGSITLGFGTYFSDYVRVWETTYGNIANHPESADVFVGVGTDALSATYYNVGSVQNIASGGQMSLAGVNGLSGRTTYNFVRIVDTSNSPLLPNTADGFDVDAVAVGPIPAPGSLALLGAAGLLAARRRRNG